MAIITFPPKYRMGKIKRRFDKGNKARYRLSQAGGGTAASFSPDDLAGLALWLEADAITGLVDNDPVATWEDSSSANNDATQGTAANRPLYKTGIINGLPVVRFDATNDGLLTANSAFTANPLSFFVVYSANNNGNARRALQGSGGANWAIGPYLNQWQVYTGAFISAGGITPGEFRVHTLIQTASGSSFWLNGSLVGTNGNNNTPNKVALGAAGTFVEALDGDLAAVIGYAADHTDSRTIIEGYLRNKYNI